MLVVFDLETTGTDIRKDRIIQFAGVKLNEDCGFKEEDFLNVVVNPGIPIPESARAIHGYSDELVKDEPMLGAKIEEILEFIGDSHIGGYNVLSFDLPMFIAECNRLGKTFSLEGRKFVDSLVLFREAVPHTLAGAVEHYCGEPLVNAHDAMVDVDATVRVLKRQVEVDGLEDFEGAVGRTMGNRITMDGRFAMDDTGNVIVNFGKWDGTRLDRVDRGYLKWMIKQSFPQDTRALVLRALGGAA